VDWKPIHSLLQFCWWRDLHWNSREHIDAILVTELTRWGRSMLDLFHTLQDLQAWNVSLVAQTGLQFDLRSAQGKLIASPMSALAEFERDLLRERVRSGIAKLVAEGQSYREISHRLGLSKNTVLDIVKRNRHLKNS
jgi:putative DNA-invertase from lambdoid prophage Rac